MNMQETKARIDAKEKQFLEALKKEYPSSFVVTLFKPERKYGLTLDDIDINLLSSDIEYYVSSKLLENKEIHKRFLDNLNKTIITIG